MNNTRPYSYVEGPALVKQHDGAGGLPAQVLIVDDNEDAAMSLTMLLELEDIRSAVAPDATAALEMLKGISPPLMLIDIGLPGMNGYELARRLREQPDTRAATLIALTGREAASEQDPDAAAFDQFWTKPFDPKKLLDEVKSIVQRGAAEA